MSNTTRQIARDIILVAVLLFLTAVLVESCETTRPRTPPRVGPIQHSVRV